MKTGFLISLLFLSMLAVLEACKKNNSKSKTQQLTQAPWKLDNAGFDYDRNGTIDAVDNGTLIPCNTDDTYTFQSGGIGTFDEGASKCNSNDPQSEPFTWQFSDNETRLVLSGDTSNIFSLDDSNLKVYNEVDTGSTNTVRYMTVLKH